MKRLWWVVALVAALVVATSSALADDTEIGSYGGSAAPLQATNISMAAETVQCVCYGGFAENRVDFRFVNSGAPRQLRLGFPFYVGGDSSDPAVAFHAWSGGAPLAVSLVPGRDADEDTDFYEHVVDFGRGVTTVTVDYLVSPTSSNVGDNGGYPEIAKRAGYGHFQSTLNMYSYTLHTGSNWAGKIGIAVLSWRLAADFSGWGHSNATDVDSRLRREFADPGDLAFLDQYEAMERRILKTSTGLYRLTLRDFEPTSTPGEGSAWDPDFYFFQPYPTDGGDEPPRYLDTSTNASSTKKAPYDEYSSDNVADGSPSTAWAEGPADGGAGQWLDMSFEESRRNVREVRILPGDAVDSAAFYAHSRPHRIRLDFGDGTSRTVVLADDLRLQRFRVSAVARSVRLTILDSYPGTQDHRVYLSEVTFAPKPAPSFDDPGELLRQAGYRATSPTASVEPGVATSHVSSEPPRPLTQSAPAIPIPMAALLATLLGVAAFTWKMTP